MGVLNGFLGGNLVGGAAILTVLGAGEIMGFSGILSPILKNPFAAAQDLSQQWKFAFLSTFLLTAYAFFVPSADSDQIESVAAVTSPFAYALSGLLVGFGVKLGNGCTSGHGINGIARLSVRSIASTLTFMTAAVVTTVVTSPDQPTGQYFEVLRSGASVHYVPFIMPTITTGILAATVYGIFTKDLSTAEINRKRIAAGLAGAAASAGLSHGSMAYPSAVRNFLDMGGLARGTWDPTLLMVMVGALLVSFTGYQFIESQAVVKSCPKLSQPWCGGNFGIPTKTAIDWKLLTGAVAFGTGWALSGACPGPAVLLTLTGLSGMILRWWPAYMVGQRFGEAIQPKGSSTC
jgi:uncharacterized membrane protein YedE/YeeE